MTGKPDRFAAVRANTSQITSRAALIYRQPWRVFRNRRLRREIRELLIEGNRLLEEV